MTSANPNQSAMTSTERRSVVSIGLLYAFRMLGLFMVLPVLSVFLQDFPDATPQLLGFALGVYGLTQAMLQLPLGWLSDRVDRRKLIFGAAAFGTAFCSLGFIGGGAIFKDKDRVAGTASAASIWNTGAIGLAVAFNRFEIAIVLSLLNFITLWAVGRFKRNISHNNRNE